MIGVYNRHGMSLFVHTPIRTSAFYGSRMSYGTVQSTGQQEHGKIMQEEFSVQAPIRWLSRVSPCCVIRYGVQNTCKVMQGNYIRQKEGQKLNEHTTTIISPSAV